MFDGTPYAHLPHLRHALVRERVHARPRSNLDDAVQQTLGLAAFVLLRFFVDVAANMVFIL